jgi:septum formation protein
MRAGRQWLANDFLDMLPLPYPVILASASPRRRELLRELVTDFEVVITDVDEQELPGESPWGLAERLAETKALAVAGRRPEALVIGGDTVVAFEERDAWRLLAKPTDQGDACAMLASLGGREHLVVTGVCVVWPQGKETFSDRTAVRFRDLSEAEIEDYVAGGEPMDKAGGYAIQGGAAGFVESVEGSVSNVIGLPLERLSEVLMTLAEK